MPSLFNPFSPKRPAYRARILHAGTKTVKLDLIYGTMRLQRLKEGAPGLEEYSVQWRGQNLHVWRGSSRRAFRKNTDDDEEEDTVKSNIRTQSHRTTTSPVLENPLVFNVSVKTLPSADRFVHLTEQNFRGKSGQNHRYCYRRMRHDIRLWILML